MRRVSLSVAFVVCLAVVTFGQSKSGGAGPAWAMNGTIIEACSCPMFCQCYFNAEPGGHASHQGGGHGSTHFCKFNNAIKVNRGHAGGVKLDGAKFWVAGDLGADFSKGQMDWAVLHFDKAVTPEQRKGIIQVLTHLYPVKWNSFTVGDDADMEWNYTPDRAVARLDGGKVAEVVLTRASTGMNAKKPVVMSNLKYWGAPRNDGFVMMPNEVEAYRLGPKAYEFKGTNGFMITFDIDEKTAPPAPGTAMNE
jgi:hypothetical protein